MTEEPQDPFEIMRDVTFAALEALRDAKTEDEAKEPALAVVGMGFNVMSSIAQSLAVIANAQLELVALAKVDLSETVKSEVETRRAEIVKDIAKRSFIGKKPG